MAKSCGKIVLGSGSPRRKELLQLLFSEERIEVVPPHDTNEGGFEKRNDWKSIEERLSDIVDEKTVSVFAELETQEITEVEAVLAADTVVVVPATNSHWKVLEKPPETENWKEVVRSWFYDYYSEKTHFVLTCFQIRIPEGRSIRSLVKSQVSFYPVTDEMLEWYLRTDEPKGKAGGYAIQGAGTVFVDEVRGSISNVVGLPLKEVLESFHELAIDVYSLDN